MDAHTQDSEFRDEDPRFYDYWLRAFSQARDAAWSLQYRGYYVAKPDGGFLPVDAIKRAATEAEWARLMEHALCFACLDGNAFDEVVEQYVPEAHENLRVNGCNPVAALTGPAGGE